MYGTSSPVFRAIGPSGHPAKADPQSAAMRKSTAAVGSRCIIVRRWSLRRSCNWVSHL